MEALKRLYRSRHKKMLFGICGGLSDMLNVDVTLLRILLIVLAVFTSGLVILVYILAGIVIPKEPNPYSGFGPGGYGGYGGGYGNGGYGGYNGGYNGGYGGGYNGGQGQGTSYGGPYKNPPYGQNPGQGQHYHAGPNPEPTASPNFDSMMDDLEKKALRKEIEELKAKLAKYEKGEF